MVVVPCPPVIVIPAGTVHAHDVAPKVVVVEYVADVCPHTDVGPEIGSGTAGFLVTAIDAVPLFPQLLLAVQVTLPITVPAVMLTVMVLVPCPLVMVIPVTPVGTVHV